MNRIVVRRGRGPAPLESALDAVEHPRWERVDRFDEGELSFVVATFPTHSLDRGRPGLWIDDEWIVAVDGHLARSSALAIRLGASRASTVELARAALHRYGEHAPTQLDGDFALVAYHRPTERIVLAVDRFGTRQLHASALEGSVAVASEPLCALHAVGRPFEPDTAVTTQMLVGWAITRERSLYRGVATMAAGTTRVLHAGGRSETLPYFRPEPAESPPRSLRAAVATLHDTLATAVRSSCEGCGRVGVLASGGLDSMVIAALARRACTDLALPPPVLFHVSTPGFASDEAPFARRLAAVLGLELVVSEIREHKTSGDPFLAEFHGPTTPAFVRLFEEAKSRGIRVLLTGEGSDELQSPTGRELDELVATKAWGAAARFAGLLGGAELAPRRALRALLQPLLPRAWVEERAIARALAALPTWLSARGERHARDAILERFEAEFSAEHPLAHKRTLASSLVGTASMTISHQLQYAFPARLGIELRHPFFDRAVYELLASLPTSLLQSPSMAKPLLRVVAAELVTADLAYRPPPTDYSLVHGATWSPSAARRDATGLRELAQLGGVEVEALSAALETDSPTFEAFSALLAAEWLSALRRAR